MSEDYKRALCQMCPFEADCRKLREEFQCDHCEEALVCGAQGKLGRKNCDRRQTLWHTLPCKCLMVGSRLRQPQVNPTDLFIWVTGAVDEDKDTSFYLCPRCMQPTLVVGCQHNHRMPHERSMGSSKYSSIGLSYFASCNNCGVDDVHKT